MMDESPQSPQDPFKLLQHGYRDMVGCTAFNSYGDRFATSSVDGKIKVYNRHRDGNWVLCDTWTAHAAEILEVTHPAPSWSHCSDCDRRFNGSPPQSIPASSLLSVPTDVSRSGLKIQLSYQAEGDVSTRTAIRLSSKSAHLPELLSSRSPSSIIRRQDIPTSRY
jgi:hypothetical protein